MHIFTDGSTASRVEKARRVLRKLTEPSAYFHDDGYPRHDRIKNDAAAVLEVLDGMHGLLLLALYHHQGGSSPVGQPIRRAEARWYCLSREGMARLCTCEEDAKIEAANAQQNYPLNGPYRAVQMVDSAHVTDLLAAPDSGAGLKA